MANAAEFGNIFLEELSQEEQKFLIFPHFRDKKDENVFFPGTSSDEHSNVSLDFLLGDGCESPVEDSHNNSRNGSRQHSLSPILPKKQNFSHLDDKKDENVSFPGILNEPSNVALDFLLGGSCESPVKHSHNNSQNKSIQGALRSLFQKEQNITQLNDKKDKSVFFQEISSNQHSSVALDFLLGGGSESHVEHSHNNSQNESEQNALSWHLCNNEDTENENTISDLLNQKDNCSRIIDSNIKKSCKDLSSDILDELSILSISPFSSRDHNDISFTDFLEPINGKSENFPSIKGNNITLDRFDFPFANLYFSDTKKVIKSAFLNERLSKVDSGYSSFKEELQNSEVDLSGAKQIDNSDKQPINSTINPALRKKSTLIKQKSSLFCKVLCSKPKANGPVTVDTLTKNLVKFLEEYNYWEYFTFDTPSPDDIIKANQKRHLYRSSTQSKKSD